MGPITEDDVPLLYTVARSNYRLPNDLPCTEQYLMHEREDAIQEAVARMWEKRHQYDETRGKKSTFLLWQARHVYQTIRVNATREKRVPPAGSFAIGSFQGVFDTAADHRIVETSIGHALTEDETCRYGHALTTENTRVRRGRRECRECLRFARKAERARKARNNTKVQ